MTKKELRIVFMGTPDFAVESLKEILKAGKNVVGVITAPDRRAGRGQQLNESAVKRFSKEKGLHILQPINLKDEFPAENCNISNPIGDVTGFVSFSTPFT